MTNRHFSYIIIFLVALLLILVGGIYLIKRQTTGSFSSINSFNDCVEAGNPVLEIYPPQCKTKDNRTFTQPIEPKFDGANDTLTP